MLDDEVLKAVAAGTFNVWSIETIEEGIEILTGVAAGSRGRNGRFPEGTVYRLVDERLRRMGEALRKGEIKPPKRPHRKRRRPERHD